MSKMPKMSKISEVSRTPILFYTRGNATKMKSTKAQLNWKGETMGNRAVITTRDKKVGIYLHWNGGRDSIEGFLTFCKANNFRSPESDSYGWLYLATVVGCFFGDGLSAGMDEYERLDCDNYDNGVYIIENWNVVGRDFISSDFKEQDGHDLYEFVKLVNSRMPKHMQLKEEVLAEAVDQRKREIANKL